MLFAGCSYCRGVNPLHCGGQFFPHFPMQAIAMGAGVLCPQCGLLPPIFRCQFCFMPQYLCLQPQTPTAQMSLAQLTFGAQQQGMQLAPVVPAPNGASESAVHGLLMEFGRGFARDLGGGLAQQLLGSFFGGQQ